MSVKKSLILVALLIPALLGRPLPVRAQNVKEDPRKLFRESIYNSPQEAKADYAKIAANLAEGIKREPESLESWLALRRLGELEFECPGFLKILDAPLETAAGLCRENGFNLRAINAFRAKILEAKGNWADSEALERENLFIDHWMVIGPFGYPAFPDYNRLAEFPPEKEINFKTNYPANDFDKTPLSWKLLRDSYGNGQMRFDRTISGDGCCFALAQLKCGNRRNLLLHVNARYPYRLQVNGTWMPLPDLFASETPNQLTLKVSLAEGWNSLLLKFPSEQSFSVLVTDDKGFKPKGVSFETKKIFWNVREKIENPSCEILEPHPLPQLRKLLEANPEDASLHLALASELSYRDEDEALEHAVTAAKLCPEPAVLLRAAWFWENNSHIPQTHGRTQAKKYRDMALEKDPNFMPALYALADYEFSNGRHREAFKRLDRIEEINPKSEKTFLTRARFARLLDWKLETKTNLQKTLELDPGNLAARQELAGYYARLGNHQKELETYLDMRSVDKSMRLEQLIAGTLKTMGRYDEAYASYSAMQEAAPNDNGIREAQAEILLCKGEAGRAFDIFRRITGDEEFEPGQMKILADMQLKYGLNPKRAIEEYRKLLAEQPRREELRRYLLYLESKDWDISAPYRADVEKRISDSAGDSQHLNAIAACILNQRVIRLNQDYSYTIMDHKAWRILSQNAQDQFGNIRVPGEALEVRTRAPQTDGSWKIYEPLSVTRGSYVMPAVDKGAIVEYRNRLFSQPPVSDAFRVQPFFFQDTDYLTAFMWSEYIVEVPVSMKDSLRFIERNLAQAGTTEEKDGFIVHRWRADYLPKLEREINMPMQNEIMPSVTVAGIRGEKEMLEKLSYRGMEDEYPTALLKSTTETIVKDAKTIEDKARAIFEFVNREIVSETGESSNAHGILLGKAGNRDTLFRALARCAGLKPVQGYAKTLPEYEVNREPDLPGMDEYRFVLTGIEDGKGSYFWMDFSLRMLPFGKLPQEVSGSEIVIPKHESLGVIRAKLPVEAPDSGGTDENVELDLGAKGEAKAKYTYNGRNPLDFLIKDQLIGFSPEDRESQYLNILNQNFPGLQLERLKFPTLEEPGKHLFVEAEFSVKLFTPRESGEMTMPICLKPLPIALYANELDRTYDMIIRFDPIYELRRAVNRQSRDRVRVRIPEGFELAKMPDQEKLDSAFGKYELKIEIKDAFLEIHREYVFKPLRVKAKDYPKFREFCGKIAKLEEQKIRWKKKS